MVRRTRVHTTAMAAALTLAPWVAQAAGKGLHWDYTCHHDYPKQWAERDTAFEARTRGTRQSPIDIRGAVNADLPTLEFQYGAAEPVTLGADQIKAFRRVYNANARPIQPVNGRVIQESM